MQPTPLEPAPVATAKPVTPDAVCSAAVQLALAAAIEVAEPGAVGTHLGLMADAERVVTHYFGCTARGYRGWRWSVTLARAPRSRTATVSEVVLLPSDGAVLAPTWLPWSQRLAPGDLGPGDELAYREDDPYLEPGYTATDDEQADRVALWELGLGRARVLSREGRQAAADRWYTGSHGPTAGLALSATAACSSCGYFLPMAGALRQVFGVCSNEWSPSDGAVVSHDHGCGAHSETDVEPPAVQPLPEPVLDERGAEPVVLPRREPERDAVAEVSAVAEPDAVAEVSEESPVAADHPAGEADPSATA